MPIKPSVASLTSLASRLLLGPLFIVSGVGKVAAPAATQAYIASAGLPAPALAYGVALAVELGLGAALLAGLLTRVAPAVLAIFTLATAIAFHADLADPVQRIQFLKNLAIAGGLLSVSAQGPGRFGLDRVLRRAPGPRPAPAALA